MKKIYLILCCLFSALLTTAQVVVKTQLPPAGLTLKSQLWNLSLVNTSPQPLRITVEVLVTDAVTNQQVFSGITRVLTLSRGLTQITPNKVIPVTYNVFGSGYNLNTSQEGFLPVGAYNICYLVSGYKSDAVERLAEECSAVDVEPVSPPVLVSPQDEERLEITRPLFNWMPPSPLLLFPRLTYEFTLVEIQPSQTGADAIQKNIPVRFQRNIRSTSLPYASSLPALDSNKQYAWQVMATTRGYPIAKSEVWTFSLKKTGKPVKIDEPADYYARLKQGVDESFVICRDVVKYSYVNELNDKTATIKIYDITNATRKELKIDSPEAVLKFGENFNSLDLTGSDLNDKRFYMLELTNSKEERWFLKFQYRKSN